MLRSHCALAGRPDINWVARANHRGRTSWTRALRRLARSQCALHGRGAAGHAQSEDWEVARCEAWRKCGCSSRNEAGAVGTRHHPQAAQGSMEAGAIGAEIAK